MFPSVALDMLEEKAQRQHITRFSLIHTLADCVALPTKYTILPKKKKKNRKCLPIPQHPCHVCASANIISRYSVKSILIGIYDTDIAQAGFILIIPISVQFISWVLSFNCVFMVTFIIIVMFVGYVCDMQCTGDVQIHEPIEFPNRTHIIINLML